MVACENNVTEKLFVCFIFGMPNAKALNLPSILLRA